MQLNTEIIPFAFGDNLVRVFHDNNGEPWWVAKDVSEILGYRMASDMTRNLDDDEKGTHFLSTPGGEQEISIISEPGLYAAIVRSSKAEAREFRRWIIHEVLPAIRKTGRYLHPSAEPFERPALAFDALPDDVKSLKPRARERCMHLALQSARLSGIGSQAEQFDLFINFCRLLASPEYSTPAASGLIGEYIRERLMAQKGSSLRCQAVYEDFCRWWGRRNTNEFPPGNRLFGRMMRQTFRKRKISNNFYLDVAFRPYA